MPINEKPTLLRWIYRSEFEDVLSLKAILQKGAQFVLGKDPLAAEAYAETNVGSFWNYLLRAQDEDEQRGISRVSEAIDPMARTLRWCSSPGAEMVRRAIRLRHRAVVLKMIDSLSDRQYEALACASLNLAGASKFVLTPKGNEGGVDFFALVPSPARCHLFSGAHHPLRIIGQSKKYTSAVQAGKFKEFLKTIDEVKHGGEPKTEKVIPPWFHSGTWSNCRPDDCALRVSVWRNHSCSPARCHSR